MGNITKGIGTISTIGIPIFKPLKAGDCGWGIWIASDGDAGNATISTECRRTGIKYSRRVGYGINDKRYRINFTLAVIGTDCGNIISISIRSCLSMNILCPGK